MEAICWKRTADHRPAAFLAWIVKNYEFEIKTFKPSLSLSSVLFTANYSRVGPKVIDAEPDCHSHG